MSEWTLSYEGYDPKFEGLRETLCTLGNGYMASRGAAANALADDTHYPGTYLAGGYNRLTTEVGGHEVENEDLVNIPNWLPLVFRIDDGPWLRPQEVEIQDYRLALSLHDGVLSRSLRLTDAEGRTTLWEERRFVSMACPHLAAIEVQLTAENWSGQMTLRSAVDGSVINSGVPRYRDLSSRHLEPLETLLISDEVVLLRCRTVQSRREIATAARTRLYRDGSLLETAREVERLPDFVAQNIAVDMAPGQAVTVEKVAAVCTSKDMGITEPGTTATTLLKNAASFEKLLRAQCRNWAHLWEECGIEIETTANSQVEMKLHLHIFHLLQTVSMHSVDLDAGVPPRGWTGEAYRGHIMWDELFIFPFLNLRKPVLTRTLLRYRHRRLPEARRAAREAGHRGAMFPWQSGSDGREESQKFHLNPMSGRWIADTSQRQRHVNAAIAFNVWQYYEVTEDREFLYDFGAELMLEIARFWASLSSFDAESGRYSIRGVMGPDEFHTAYPGKDASTDGGLDNNAYTNVMVSWLMTRTLDMLDLLPGSRRRELFDALEISSEELRAWEDISRNLVIPIDSNGVIAQFEGYEALKEFDWEGYREKYGDIQRLDRILEGEGLNPNDYKLSKQADVLMIFYLFSTEELTEIFSRLDYPFTPDTIFKTIDYYTQRTSHGSTLSWIVHAWVMARADRERSWKLLSQALDSDVHDLQGGTTAEGIHLGGMAGTVDLVQRCYLGIEPRANVLTFNPQLPRELERLKTTVRYRGQSLDVEVTPDKLKVSSRLFTAYPITIAYRGRVREISPGQSFEFLLIRHHGHDQAAKRHARAVLQSQDCRPKPPPQDLSAE